MRCGVGVLSVLEVPSTATNIQITTAAASQVATAALTRIAAAVPSAAIQFKPFAQRLPTPVERDAAMQAEEKQPPVVVGVTPTCPYGISACGGVRMKP